MSGLIDRNVLKANMYQEAFESDTDMQKWDSGCWIRYKLFKKVVDSTPTVPYGPRWHRVEERLPDDSREVIIFTASKIIGVGSFIRPNWYQWYSGGGLPVDVTHWMSLPEPPKETHESKA